jgi:hypothetical protein
VRGVRARALALRAGLALAAAALLAWEAGTARAQATYRSSPVGGRSALMGGTGVALARDGAAPFLNPATITHIDDSGVAFSVNFYTAQWSTLSGFHQPGPAGASRYGALSLPSTDLDASHADALPSTLCLFLTIGAWGDNVREPEPDPGHRKGRRKLAACLGTVERQGLSATAAGYGGASGSLTATQATSVQRSWNRLYVGPTYSVYVSDRVSLGASLHGVGTTDSSTWSVDTLVYQGAGPAASSAYDTSMNAYSIDLTAALGVVWHVDASQVLGASISTPSVHLLGDINSAAGLQAGSSAQLATSSGRFSAPPPMRVAVGVGSERPRTRVEADASAYVPVTYLARADLQTTQTVSGAAGTASKSFPSSLEVDGRPLVDAAFGLEGFVSSKISLLGGASLDFSAMQPLPLHPAIGTLAETRMQRAAAAFGVGSYGDGSELLFGAELSYAWGQSVAFDPYAATPGLALVDQRTWGVVFVIAGSASLSAFRRTLRDLGDVVRFPKPQ